VAGACCFAGIFVLHADARRLFDRLLGPGLPFLIVSGAAGLAALLLLRRASRQVVRVLALVAVAAVVAGWGMAQYPFLLGTHVSIREAAAPPATLHAVVVVFIAAALLLTPSFALLYLLQQRGELDEP
jgi:cytochrome d ubiquinol oxidase subunit II